MTLTEHFTLEEFTTSATARSRSIYNTLLCSNPQHARIIDNLKNLCTDVLEPLREHVRQPVLISSGYRSPELNKAVGGARNSQHMLGEAADIHIPDEETGREWFRWIMDNVRFDQLIWEKASAKSSRHWIHVSYRKGRCRQTVVRNMVKTLTP